MGTHLIQSWKHNEPALTPHEETRVRLVLHNEDPDGNLLRRDTLGRLEIDLKNFVADRRQDIVERIRGLGLAAGTSEEFLEYEIGSGMLAG